jgi:hypothetical protein
VINYFQCGSKTIKTLRREVCLIFAGDWRLYNFHCEATFGQEQNTFRPFFVLLSLPFTDKTARHMVPWEQQNSTLTDKDGHQEIYNNWSLRSKPALRTAESTSDPSNPCRGEHYPMLKDSEGYPLAVEICTRESHTLNQHWCHPMPKYLQSIVHWT